MPYKPIPVAVARHIGDAHGKDIVLIVGWDQDSAKTSIVTWGREPGQKGAAAAAGEKIEHALGLTGAPVDVHEDFRREGEAAKRVDDLQRRLDAIRKALDEIVISEGQDAGVILLSSESPTHYDPEAKCQVYEHEFFSPLGDALVSVARLAAESVSVPCPSPIPDNGTDQPAAAETPGEPAGPNRRSVASDGST